MSYTSRRMQKSSLGPRGRGMGDVIDDSIEKVRAALYEFIGKAPPSMPTGSNPLDVLKSTMCAKDAIAVGEGMFAKANDLSSNWNPPGLYSIEQMKAIVSSTMSVLMSASSKIDTAMSNWMKGDQRERLASHRTAIQRKMSDEGLVFTNAMGAAIKASIQIVDAPGLKAWVVSSMRTAAGAMVAASYEVCTIPSWLSMFQSFQEAFDVAWNVIRKIAGVAAELGMAVLKIPDTVGQIWTMAKWASIGVLAWWAYENVPKHLKGA